ncbi:MAG: SU10 major capsid protein, partial [Hyphomicrobium sp.]
MATITNAFTTSSAIGIREDLTNRIHRVDVEDTPFLSSVGTTTAKQPLHSWQTRTLGAVNTANAEPEGNETARAAATPNVRLSNVCQISTKNATVSGTLESSDLAGRTSEMALQMADRMIELRKDMEYTLLSNQAYNAGATR